MVVTTILSLYSIQYSMLIINFLPLFGRNSLIYSILCLLIIPYTVISPENMMKISPWEDRSLTEQKDEFENQLLAAKIRELLMQ
jgi:hypothetical protein